MYFTDDRSNGINYMTNEIKIPCTMRWRLELNLNILKVYSGSAGSTMVVVLDHMLKLETLETNHNLNSIILCCCRHLRLIITWIIQSFIASLRVDSILAFLCKKRLEGTLPLTVTQLCSRLAGISHPSFMMSERFLVQRRMGEFLWITMI